MAETLKKKPGIFISYSSKDLDWAASVEMKLSRAGYNTWRDKSHIRKNWSQEIAKALARSDLVCLMWSKNSASSPWVKHEWLTARALNKHIVPCFLSGYKKLPYPLQDLDGVTFSGKDEGAYQSGPSLIDKIKSFERYTGKYEFSILPRPADIPFRHNPQFVGRSEDLVQLYLQLIGGLRKVGISNLGMVGMGGIGKTQLAVEYAYRFGFAYEGIFWVNAADAAGWKDAFAAISRKLGIKVNDSGTTDRNREHIVALYDYFSINKNYLVIMDNVNDPGLLNNDELFVEGLAPIDFNCDLLFTTRKRFDLPGANAHLLDILTENEAVELLTSYRKTETGEGDKVKSICNALGYLPLAIVLAGARMQFLKTHQPGFRYADFLKHLEQKKLDVIDWKNASESDLATRHKAAVRETLNDQWHMVENENARHIFKLAGQFSESEIVPLARLGLLSGLSLTSSQMENPLTDAFAELLGLCLVEALTIDASVKPGGVQGVRLHPMVRAFAAEQVAQTERALFRQEAAVKMARACLDGPSFYKEFSDRGHMQVLEDIEMCLKWLEKNDPRVYVLNRLQGALRLSSMILVVHPGQFINQLKGRLGNDKDKMLSAFLDSLETLGEQSRLVLETPSLDSPDSPVLCKIPLGYDGRIAADREGRYLAAASGTSIDIWDIEKSVNTGVPSVLAPHTKDIRLSHDSNIRAVCISSSGPCLAVGLETGSIMTLPGPDAAPHPIGDQGTDPVTAIEYCVDDTRIIAGYGNGAVGIFDTESGRLLHHENPMDNGDNDDRIQDGVFDLAVSSDGNWAVTAHSDGRVRAWDLVFCRLEWEWMAFDEDPVTGIAITPDNHWLVAHSGYSYRTKVFCLNGVDDPGDTGHLGSGKIRDYDHIPGHRLTVAGNGNLAVSVPEQGFTTVWDIETGQEVRTIDFRSMYIHSILSTAGTRPYIIGADNSIITIMDVNRSGGLEARHMTIGRYPPCWEALSRDGRIGASICFASACLDLWDMTENVPRLFENQTAAFLYPDMMDPPVFSTAPLGYSIAGLVKTDIDGVTEHQIRILDVNRENETVSIPGKRMDPEDPFPLPCIALSPDGRLVMVIWHERDVDGKIQAEVWNTTTQCRICDSTIPASCDIAAISRNGCYAVLGSKADLRLFDFHHDRLIPCAIDFGEKIKYVSTSWNSRYGIAVFISGRLIAWDMASGRILSEIKLAFIPKATASLSDNKHIVVMGGRRLEVWNYASGERLDCFTSDNDLSAFSVDSDHSHIYTVDHDDRVHALRLNL